MKQSIRYVLAFLLVFFLCSPFLGAQNLSDLASLKMSLLKAKDLSLSLEQRMQALLLDNQKLQENSMRQSTEIESLRSLSAEQELRLSEQSPRLQSLENSLIESSKLLTSYTRSNTIMTWALRIGIPVSIGIGIYIGWRVSK